MKPISTFKRQKNELSVILLTSIAFALGINIVSSFASIFVKYQIVLSAIGVLFVVVSAVVTIKVLWAEMKTTLRINGAVAIVIENDQMTKKEIIGYDFNNDFYEYLNSFLNENQAYKKLFIESSKAGIQKLSRFSPDEINFHSIMNSVMELVYLSQLSQHLNSYFIDNEIDSARIRVLSRKDLDSAILKNRVLDLITRDMVERAAFIDNPTDFINDSNGIVYYAQGSNDIVYERVELELPPESKINRNNHGFLEIENKLFKLTFRPIFEGFSTNMPDELISKSERFYSPYLIRTSLEIIVKKTIFVSERELDIYEWLDSFIGRFESYMSSEKLKETVNLTTVRLLNSLLNTPEKRNTVVKGPTSISDQL